MSPKKPKDFIKPTAESLEEPVALVDDVVSFYWSNVRKALSDIEGPSITVLNLGTFKARYNRIHKIEEKYNNYLKDLKLSNMTFNKHTIQDISKRKLENLDKIRKQMEEEYQRKHEVKIKRREYVTNKALEEQRKDTGGIEE